MTEPNASFHSAEPPRAFAAHAVDCGGPPEWRPLLEIAGEHARDFMWMTRITLEDGKRVEAYKHRQTRRYLHISMDGVAYTRVVRASGGAQLSTTDRYRPTSRHAALELVFREWHPLNEGAPDYEAMSRSLECVLAIAEAGGRMDYDPEWLVRQRRFEAGIAKAQAFERANDPRYRGASPGVDGDAFFGDLDDLDERAAA